MADEPISSPRALRPVGVRSYTPRQLHESDMETAQQNLREQYKAIQKRAQELMENMDIPETGPMENPGPLPMGAVDAADYPARLEAKDMMAAPQEQDAYYIGAGVPSDIAAQYGIPGSEGFTPVASSEHPLSENAPRQYRAGAFNNPDVESNMKSNGRFNSDEDREPKKYKRQVITNWKGVMAYVFFTLSFGFYMWIRIAKTLDLGPYIVYGAYVLIVEILGASTVFLYGTNLLFDPVMEKPEEDEANPGRPKVSMPYHVRVLVPCYKEDIAIVRRTVMAAYDAVLPEGCQRTIYLCDDGKDPKKRKFCEGFSDEVKYVSGRKRQTGEMNGKSGNINNCCSQIYPRGVKIPGNELVCIFDADQVASTSFYLKTLPLFDGGDDVGMVLSPQCFHNLNLHADIFNHSNVHFWEYMQPGYDALGFISCTGTNFIVRSNALREVGGSPTFTLTEDFALGMNLKIFGWQCRYVQEYLAIGEAPDQVRNCYQQRSRWCKGHFQIFFNKDHCPLFQTKLSPFMRLLYCSGVWSYVVGAISTPTFIIIPIITIWFGIFPIVISWWAALGLTVYMVATHSVLYYCRSPKHVEALWFANVGNQVLWWTYVKACWRAAGSACAGKGITFKTTMKGAGLMAGNNIQDLWMPASCLLLLGVSIIYGLVDLFSGAIFWSPLIISIFWAAYNVIPPLLVCWYGWVGKGASLQWLCRICLALSFVFSAGAIIFMWFLYPTSYDYNATLKNSMFFYEANMVGNLPPSVTSSIPWRGSAMTGDLTPIGTDLTGGWLTGDAANVLKMTFPMAWTTSLLAWSLLSDPSAYSKANSTARALDQLQWGSEYLLKTIYKDADNNTQIIYQVGNYTAEANYWGRVEDIKYEQSTYSTAVVNGSSDIGGQIVAALAASSLVFADISPALSAQLLTAATSLYSEITNADNLGRYSNIVMTGCRSNTDPIQADVPLCPPLSVYLGGSAIELYDSDSFYDDLLWAASWMYKATGSQLAAYMSDVQTYYIAHVYQEQSSSKMVYNWNNMYWASNVFLAQLTNEGTFHERTQYFLKTWICGFGSTVTYTPRGSAANINDPTQGATQAAAFLGALYGNYVAPSNKAKSRKYLCWARSQTRYVLGESGRSRIVGAGKDPPTHVRHMPASCPLEPLPCNFVDAFLSPSANPHILYGALVEGDVGSDSFADVRTLNGTRVGIETNAAFTGAIASLVGAPGNWELCLQGYGPLNKGTGGVC